MRGALCSDNVLWIHTPKWQCWMSGPGRETGCSLGWVPLSRGKGLCTSFTGGCGKGPSPGGSPFPPLRLVPSSRGGLGTPCSLPSPLLPAGSPAAGAPGSCAPRPAGPVMSPGQPGMAGPERSAESPPVARCSSFGGRSREVPRGVSEFIGLSTRRRAASTAATRISPTLSAQHLAGPPPPAHNKPHSSQQPGTHRAGTRRAPLSLPDRSPPSRGDAGL